MTSEDKTSCIECDSNFLFYLKLIGKIAFAMSFALYEVNHKLHGNHSLHEAFEDGTEEKIKKAK